MKETPRQSSPQYVSTAAVSAALGVSVTTVKRWVDDGILPAHRTAGGHRKLLLADVTRLVYQGALPQADLSRLDAKFASGRALDPAALTEPLFAALQKGDGPRVRALIRNAHDSGMRVEDLADRVIAPVMARIGHEWEMGAIDVLHEHRNSQLIAAAVYELTSHVERNARRVLPIAIGGIAIAGDPYVLPTLLVQAALLEHGWQAINFGPNTPFASMTKAIAEFRPRLLWVSISYLADPVAFADEYRQFYHLAEKCGVAVVIGGRALPEELRARLPYTAYGDSVAHLIAFARTLHAEPRPPKRGRPVKP